jgi:hypothetical protein
MDVRVVKNIPALKDCQHHRQPGVQASSRTGGDADCGLRHAICANLTSSRKPPHRLPDPRAWISWAADVVCHCRHGGVLSTLKPLPVVYVRCKSWNREASRSRHTSVVLRCQPEYQRPLACVLVRMIVSSRVCMHACHRRKKVGAWRMIASSIRHPGCDPRFCQMACEIARHHPCPALHHMRGRGCDTSDSIDVLSIYHCKSFADCSYAPGCRRRSNTNSMTVCISDFDTNPAGIVRGMVR